MRDTNRQSARVNRARRTLGLGLTHLLPFVILLGTVLVATSDAEAQRIRVLEADTLQSSKWRERDIDITVDVGSDTSSTSIRIGTSRWKRGGHESASLVRFGEDIIVEQEDVIDGSVVAFGGDVIIRGRVLEDVVSFGGDVLLEEGGVVEGDAAAFGGSITRATGSDLLGEEVGVAFVPSTLGTSLRWPGGGRTFWTLFTLSVFLFLGIAGLAIEWVLPFRVRRMAEHVSSSLWASFFVGLAAHVLVGPLIALLAVTVIGIPVALLLPIFFTLAQIIGFLVVAAVIGAKFSDGSLKSRPAWVRSVLAGVALFAVMNLLAVIIVGLGGIVGMLGRLMLLSLLAALWTVSTIGLGAVTLSRFGSRSPTTLGADRGDPTIAGGYSSGSARTV